MKRYRLPALFFALAFILQSACLFAQFPSPFVLGTTHQLHSDALNEDRLFNIYLPEGYEADTSHYPLIYLLDGSAGEDFVHICGLVQFFTLTGRMPKTIVVGIANVDRKRDFTFPTTIEKDKTDFPTTGGSAAFIQFMEQELQPYIKANFRCSGKQTLIGQSLGGLLAAEILCKHPRLFDQYIIVSPSFWWDNQSLLNAFEDKSFSSSNSALDVFVAVGKEHPMMVKDAKKFAGLLKRQASAAFKTAFSYLPDEDHATVLHAAVYAAFKYFFPAPAEK